jgi:serine/threonine-protein kinase RsbW
MHTIPHRAPSQVVRFRPRRTQVTSRRFYISPAIDLSDSAVLRITAASGALFLGIRQGPMAADQKHLEVTLQTQVESVNLAEEMCLRVAEAAGFGEDDCYRIGMSVREGVINAFHYGNQERPDKKIHLAVDLTDEKMIIHVLDEGKGFDLASVPNCLSEENLLSTSGRGIFLMRSFMDEFNVVKGRTGGAEIVMSKKLPPPGSAPNGTSGQNATPHQEA